MAYKAGFLGLIGQPNAGKSSLMNFLVQEKISIVTPKPQTTRRRIIGVWNSEAGQIAFVDAPGILDAAKGLNGFLAIEAKDVIEQSDALIAVLAVDGKNAEEPEQVLKMVKASGKPWVAVITKVDMQDKAHRVMILKDMVEKMGGKAFTISSTKEKNDEDREALLIELLEIMPESPQPMYDVELFTTESMRNMVAELIREKCFEFLHQEVPFNTAIRIIKFDELASPIPKIAAEIVLAKETHKGIVIGKGGSVLKQIGTEARKEIEKLMGEKIFLDLKVSVREDWFDNTKIMKELGYVLDTKSDN